MGSPDRPPGHLWGYNMVFGRKGIPEGKFRVMRLYKHVLKQAKFADLLRTITLDMK